MNKTETKRKGLSTFLWMLITLTLIVLVPLTLFVLYQTNLTRNIVMEEKGNHLHATSHYLAREMDGYISDSMDEVGVLAGTDEVQSYLADEGRTPQEAGMLKFLEKFRRIGGYNAAYLMDGKGECVASTSPKFVGKNYSFRPYFKNAVAGRPYFYMAVGVTSDIPGFYFSAPVYHNGRIAGVAVGKALISKASNNFSDRHFSESINVFLTTEDGVVIAGSNPAFLLKSLVPLSAETKGKLQKSRQFSNRDIPSLNFGPLWEHIRTGKQDKSASYTDPAASSERFAVFAPLSEQKWNVVVSEDAEVIQAYVNNQIKKLLLVGLAACVLIWLASYGAGKILSRQIGNMSKTILKIGSGRHDLRVKPEGPRELKEMCREFNHMADKLSSSCSSLEKQVAERTTELAKKIEQLEGSERRQKLIFENSPTGMMMVNSRREIVEINTAALAILQRKKEEVTGHICHDFVCPTERGNCPVFDRGETVHVSEKEFLNSRGEKVPVLLSLVQLRLEGEAMLLESFIEITEHKRAQEEIRQAGERAEAAGKELEEKVGELEHFSRLAIGREKRMIELKRRFNSLCEKFGEVPPYDLSFAEAETEGTRNE